MPRKVEGLRRLIAVSSRFLLAGLIVKLQRAINKDFLTLLLLLLLLLLLIVFVSLCWLYNWKLSVKPAR